MFRDSGNRICEASPLYNEGVNKISEEKLKLKSLHTGFIFSNKSTEHFVDLAHNVFVDLLHLRRDLVHASLSNRVTINGVIILFKEPLTIAHNFSRIFQT